MFPIWKWGKYEILRIHFSEYYHQVSRTFSTSRQHKRKLTHYEVLGITRKATAKDIRAAFIKKSKECHPDANRSDPNKHKQFVLVNEAYSVLIKPYLRHDYDATITHNQVHEYSKPQKSRPVYYHPHEHYDEQIHRASQVRDEDYKNQSYNSTKHQRISNSKVVAFCILTILAGIATHYIVFQKSTSLHLKTLNERDAKIREAWAKAKKQAELYSAEDQILILLQNEKKKQEQRSNVEEN